VKPKRIPMSVDEYRLLPQQRGWKYEYVDGNTIIRPRQTVVVVERPVSSSDSKCPFSIEQPNASHRTSLSEGLYLAFEDSFEFSDYKADDFQKAVASMTDRFYKYADEGLAWVMTVPHGEDVRVLAGCYVKPKKTEGVGELEALFIRPEWQRAGLATLLLDHLNSSLVTKGIVTLRSSYFYGNVVSEAWHTACGFVTLPDLELARLRLHDAKERNRRLKFFGALKQEHEDEVAMLAEGVNRLEQVADEKGYRFVAPILDD
jgi:N-acetylglutamate synthase-like GNAT family acetyltransferase